MATAYEADNGRLKQLRQDAEKARRELIEAEAQLAEQMGEVRRFEARLERRLGELIDGLARVEQELAEYHDVIKRRRNEAVFGGDYRSVDEQYRRTWAKPPEETKETITQPAPSLSEEEMKRLYRQLARRFHPDLAANEGERRERTVRMTAVNDAYAARNEIELLALAEELDDEATGAFVMQTTAEMMRALTAEIDRCQRRVREIGAEIQNFHHHPIVQLSLETKLARRQGRDLLAEMAQKLQRKLAQKSAERDMIKSQFDNLEYG
jgi:hypothetical protein